MAEAAKQGIVDWHGPIPNDTLPTRLADFDVCVAFTRSSEIQGGGGTSNAMMEQMAAGRIMLAWNNAIFRQWLNAENGYMVPQDDVEAAYRCLADILHNKTEALRRAAAGPQTLRPFSIEAMVDKFDDCLTGSKNEVIKN